MNRSRFKTKMAIEERKKRMAKRTEILNEKFTEAKKLISKAGLVSIILNFRTFHKLLQEKKAGFLNLELKLDLTKRLIASSENMH